MARKKQSLVRFQELIAQGMSRSRIVGMLRRGELFRVDRGLYQRVNQEPTENFSVAAVAKRVPGAVVCLLTALRIHGIGAQEPGEIWIAIDHKARAPVVRGLPIRIVRFSGASMRLGIESVKLEGIACRITSPSRTVVDCFRYRNKIGLEVGLEALREALRTGTATRAQIRELADALRAGKVMQPYLESLSG